MAKQICNLLCSKMAILIFFSGQSYERFKIVNYHEAILKCSLDLPLLQVDTLVRRIVLRKVDSAVGSAQLRGSVSYYHAWAPGSNPKHNINAFVIHLVDIDTFIVCWIVYSAKISKNRVGLAHIFISKVQDSIASLRATMAWQGKQSKGFSSKQKL